MPSGCQFWHRDIISASTENFAYCSPIAIYIHSYSKNFQCSKLFALNSENNTTRYTILSFHPQISNVLACFSTENILSIWDVEKEKITFSQTFPGPVSVFEWNPFETDSILLAFGGFDVFLIHLRFFFFLEKQMK